jgi:hypothetical protein
MKKYILLVFIAFATSNIKAQNIQTADYFVGLGERFSYKKQYDSAIWAFKYVLENFPNKNQECSRAMFRIAGVYERDSVGMALKWYNKIIDSEKVNDKDKGMDLLEPYANYKHNSCIRIAALQAKRKNYDESLRYLDLALHTYKFNTYVATSFEFKMVNIAQNQSEYYKQLGYDDSAIYILVQKIFDTNIKYRLPEMDEKSSNEVDFYGKISITAAKLIDNKYGLGPFKFELNKALGKMKVKKDSKNHLAVCTFKLYGITYKITSTLDFYKKANFIYDFKASKLWIELEKG